MQLRTKFTTKIEFLILQKPLSSPSHPGSYSLALSKFHGPANLRRFRSSLRTLPNLSLLRYAIAQNLLDPTAREPNLYRLEFLWIQKMAILHSTKVGFHRHPEQTCERRHSFCETGRGVQRDSRPDFAEVSSRAIV